MTTSLDTLLLAATREISECPDLSLKSALVGAAYRVKYPLDKGQLRRVLPILRMIVERGRHAGN